MPVLLPVLALLAASAADSPPAWLEVREGKTFVVAGSAEAEVAGNRLEWSPDGRRIAIHASPDGRLQTFSVGSRNVFDVADRASRPAWAPNGAKIAYLDGSVLRVFDASMGSEPARTAARTAQAFGWSPDSQRLAYAQADGIWVADSYGEGARRVLRGRVASALAWSPDGGRLAFVESGLGTTAGRVWMVRPSGVGLRKIGAASADRLEYSPNGKWLLAGNREAWTVIEEASGKSTSVSATGRPQWVGGAKLLLPRGTDTVAWSAPTGSAEPPASAGLPAGIMAWAPRPYLEVTADLAGSGLPKDVPRPRRGRTVLQGYVDAAEPIEGRFTLQVRTAVDGSGREIHYANPIEQRVRLDERGEVVGRAIRSVELRLDAEVTLVVDGALNAQSELPIRGGWVEGEGASTLVPLRAGPRLQGLPLEYDGVSPERVVVSLVFPVLGRSSWSDWFLAARGGGTRRHHGQDIMAPKMTPMVACFDGVVSVGRSRGQGGHNTIKIRGDNGWIANYYHVNNDTPGTNDGLGTDEYAFAPGLESGQRVFAGQFIGYVGNSGNAETTAPHLHFELWDSVTRGVINAAPSLRAAQKVVEPMARALGSEVATKAGEIRIEGIVREIDRAKGVVRAQVLGKTKNGRLRAATANESVYARMGKSTEVHLLGNENMPLKLEDLRPGLYAVFVGPPAPTHQAMSPRRAAFGIE